MGRRTGRPGAAELHAVTAVAAAAPDRARFARVRAWLEARPRAADALLLGAVTAVSALLRLVRLGAIPYGVHSDEAQVGTDAHRILHDGWIGVYTHAALGQPTGHAYLTTPSIWALGDTAFALRLPLALVALAAVPLLYLLVRTSFGRTEATFAALMLAFSYWHLFYSRVAHWSISYGTVLLAVLLCLALALRTLRWWWFVAGGALLGLGVYTYNIYPVAVLAAYVFIAVMSLRIVLRARRTAAEVVPDDALPEPRPWLRGVALFTLAALVVALPMINYLRNPDAYYWKHFDNYGDVRVTRTPEYREADFAGKVRLIAAQAKFFASAYAWHGRKDIVDANGLRPVFDPLTLALIGGGLFFAWRYRRNPVVIAAVVCFVILPLPAVLQRGSIMRQPVAAAPYAMLLAALPLAALWRAPSHGRGGVRFATAGAAAFAVAVVAGVTVHDYFWTLRKDPFVREIYFSQMTTASTYIRHLPPGTYVYFYDERASINLETRQFLAPDAKGEDRSREFSPYDASIEGIDRSRPVSFVLMGAYTPLIDAIAMRYPGGAERIAMRDGKLEFVAYELPARGG